MTSQHLPQGTTQNTISLLLGHPDPETLLTPELYASIQQALNAPDAYAALQYGPEQGTHSLINALVDKICREQQIAVQAEHMMITAGSTHAVDMLTRLYARSGGIVLVEAPTYTDALHIFRDHQVELHAIPMDEGGLIPTELEKQIRQLHAQGKTPRMLYTIPNFQNPTGCTLSQSRRLEIIKLAQQYGMLIVEDDVYHDLSFTGSVPASFYALAEGKQVVSIGSFSKTLAPGLRLGWLLASPEIVQRCINCGTTQMGGGANPFTAYMIAEYCRKGYWDTHIQHIRSLYKVRCDTTLDALARYMPADVQWSRPEGGFFIWFTLPHNVFAQDVKSQALQAGVAVASGEGFFLHPSAGEHHLRLAYSRATLDEIDAGIRILAQVINKQR